LGLGAAFQISKLYGVNVWNVFWPFIIVWIGISMFLPRSHKKKYEKSSTITGNEIDETVQFSNVEKIVKSENFKGGRLSCSFGRAILDLRKAKLGKDGGNININCSFGSVEVRAPKEWKIISNGTASAGEWRSNFENRNGLDLPTLRIEGSVSFGEVEITN
jgi:predicted membrane protein